MQEDKRKYFKIKVGNNVPYGCSASLCNKVWEVSEGDRPYGSSIRYYFKDGSGDGHIWIMKGDCELYTFKHIIGGEVF